ncbi:TonB-dependent receptor [bacterium]|nr:TonB-dependent receptor [bacterium]
MNYLLLIFFLFLPKQIFSQTSEIVGKVFVKGSNLPVPFANVFLPGTNIFTQTNENGIFSLKTLLTGNFTIEVSHVNFQTQQKQVQVSEFNKVSLNFYLEQKSFEIEEVVISGLSQNVQKTKQIISRQEILNSKASSVSEILETLSGVYVQTSSDGTSKINLRGAGNERVAILYDGENLATGSQNALDLSLYNLQNLEKIEVYKGNSSALFGSGAIGGAINLVPVKAQNFSEFGTSFSFGNHTTLQNHNFFSLKNKFHFSLSESCSKGDFSYKDQVGTTNFQAKLQNNQRKQVASFFSFSKDFERLKLSGFTDFFLRKRQIPKLISEADKKLQENELKNSLKLSLSQSKKNSETELSFGYGFLRSDFEQNTNPFLNSKTETQSAFVSARFSDKSLVFGTKFLFESQDKQNVTTYTETKIQENSKAKRQNLSVFGTKNFQAKNTEILFSSRFDKVFDKGKKVGGNYFSPKVEVFHTLFKGLILESSLGKGFRLPEFSSLFLEATLQAEGNQNLKPEQSYDFSFGGKFENGFLEAETNFFYSQIFGVIVWRRNLYNRYSPTNDEKAESKGLETSLSFEPLADFVKLSGNYTFNLATNKTNEPNKKNKILPNRPKHTANFVLSVKKFDFDFRTKAIFIGKRYETESNQDDLAVHNAGLGSFWKVDFVLERAFIFGKWKTNLAYFLGNAFNKTYSNFAYNPNPRRNHKISLEIRF